jgi:hypothetical protein
MDSRRTAVRRALLTLTLLALVWAAVLALTGGVAVSLAGVRLSSRSPRNPLLIAIVSAFATAVLARRTNGGLGRDVRWLAALVAAAVHAYRRHPWVRWLDLATATAIGGATLIVGRWLGARPLWLDEEMIALNARDRPFAELAGTLWLDQSAPLGWLATERAVMGVFGLGEAAVRALPAVVGMAAVAAAAWVGRRWMTAAGAVALVAMSSLGLWTFHYALEVKPYSGDTLFGVLLPALVVWATEGDSPRTRLKRAGIWWALAAGGQWFAYGALFVAPACAAALLVALWRIDGWRSATTFAFFGIGWLVTFGLNYLLVLRFTLENDVLREFWPVLPASTNTTLLNLADDPGGATRGVLFWAAAVCGFALARRRSIGYVFGAVPLSAFVLGAVGLVPLQGRLALWTVPALYVGIASCAEAGAWRLRDASARAHPVRVAVAMIVLVAGLWVSVDIVRRGWREIVEGFPPDSNHAYDDRSGVRWLVAQRRPGDAVLATRFSLPGVWWYGGIPLASPTLGTALPDGSPVFEVFHVPNEEACNLRDALARYPRVLLYMGFPDRPDGFDDLVLRELARTGQPREVRRFSTFSLAAVVQLNPGETPRAGDDGYPVQAPRLDGCVSVQPARRW